MYISKKVPIIVSIVLVLIWVFLGYRSALHIGGGTADPSFYWSVTLKEDVSFVEINKVIDAKLGGEPYDHTDLPAGSEGRAIIGYSRRHTYVNNPEKDIWGFSVYFSRDGKSIGVGVKTGPESQLDKYHIYYKKIENYEEIISEYNNKVKEAKAEWGKQAMFRILIGMAVAAVFSVAFLLNCIVANKFKMHPVVFAIMCFVYVVFLIFAMLISTIF